MLKQRLITALILAPIVLWAVLIVPNQYLMLLLALLTLVGGYEWVKLAGVTRRLEQWLLLLCLALCMAGLAYLSFMRMDWVLWIMSANALWWLVVLVRLRRFTGAEVLQGVNPYQLIEGLIVLVPAWLALVIIHRMPPDGPVLLVFLLLLIWSADIGAYFSGRRWGRVKLAPRVSPGKTREGVYGGMAAAVVCGLLLAWWRDWELTSYPLVLALSLLTALVSVVGDLFVSMLKRLRGVKDSGALLPGHGGLLDRIDSLTAAAPLFLLGLILLGETP